MNEWIGGLATLCPGWSIVFLQGRYLDVIDFRVPQQLMPG